MDQKKIIKSKTVITCGVIACLILCTAGTKMASDIRGEAAQSSSTPLIIPRNMSLEEGYSASQPESFESYQIRILRNQNNLQAEKIKSLRDELLEVTHKLHELTPLLFMQGDKVDQGRLAELAIKLQEKGEEVERLNEGKSHLEIELAQAKKKLNEMDTIKEGLTVLVDKHRSLKEQNTIEFKKQIDELKMLASAEASQLHTKIQQHELIQERLQGEIVEKEQAIIRLDTIVAEQDRILSAQEKRIDTLNEEIARLYADSIAMSEAYAAYQQNLEDKIDNLNIALSAEQSQTAQLQEFKEKMEWISDLYEGSVALLNDEIDILTTEIGEYRQINEELRMARALLETQKEELNRQLAAQLDYSDKTDQQVEGLSNALAAEQDKNDDLKNLEKDLKEQLKASDCHARELETCLMEAETLLTAKQEELDLDILYADQAALANQNQILEKDSYIKALQDAHASYQQAMKEQLDELTFALQEEKIRAQLLETTQERVSALELDNIVLADENVRLSQLLNQEQESNLLAREQSNLQEIFIESLQNDLAEVQQKVEQLAGLEEEFEVYQDTIRQRNELISKIEEELEIEKSIHLALQDDLQYARRNYVQEHSSRRNLELILQEAQSKINEMEKKFSQQISDIASQAEP
jgi:hypothetical protein